MSRPETRYRADFPVYVTWQERQGGVRRANGTCLDISASGALVETIDPIPSQCTVLLQSKSFGRMGHATVRYCRRPGMKYKVGLQFTSPITLSDSMRQQLLEEVVGGNTT